MSKNKFANTNLSTAIKKQYLDASTADMHFTFDSSASKIKPIPAHKSFLVASSDVFRDMFSKSSKKNDSVEIDDATAVAFKEFLQFFYCDEVKLSLKNVEEVFRLGHKYHVAACINICTQLLLKNVTDENVCSVYGLGILADQDELKALCEMNIGTKPTEIFKTSGFLKCDREVMRNILMLDSLSCSEMEVFNGCMDWVRAKSKDKLVDKTTALAHLGNSLYDIRFGLMTKDEVNEIFSSYKNLFTADERTEIIKVITSKDTKSTMIKAKPRNWDWEKKSLIKCVRKIVPVEYRSNAVGKIYPYEIRQPEISTFTVNAVLMLRAVVCGKLKFFRKYQWLQEIYDDLENVELKVIESSVAFKATQIKKKYGFNDEDHEGM